MEDHMNDKLYDLNLSLVFLLFHHALRLSQDGKSEPLRLVQHFSVISEISATRELTYIIIIATHGWIVTVLCRSEVELVVGIEKFAIRSSDTKHLEMVAFARRDEISVVA